MHQTTGTVILGRNKPLGACAKPQEAVREVCAPFLSGKPEEIECEEVGKGGTPEPFGWLLVHRSHDEGARGRSMGSRWNSKR